VLPPVPKNIPDVHNAVDTVQHVTANRGEKFVLQNDRENHIIIIGSESDLNQLAAADVILMDGNFDFYPKFFVQDFAIPCAANGRTLSIFAFLLASE
jgi:hypothetical protein